MRFHTSLPVRDLQATIDFYTTLFGAPPVKTKADYAKFLPPTGGLNISFHHNPDAVGALETLHLGFELPDQAALDRVHARVQEAGLISVARDTSICCYANQDKFWVTDPNGYAWELYHLLEDTEVRIEASTTCCASPDDAPADAAQSGCC